MKLVVIIMIIFHLDENNLAIVIADVSGDGIPAALIMASFVQCSVIS